MGVGFGRDGCSVRTSSISTMPGPWQEQDLQQAWFAGSRRGSSVSRFLDAHGIP